MRANSQSLSERMIIAGQRAFFKERSNQKGRDYPRIISIIDPKDSESDKLLFLLKGLCCAINTYFADTRNKDKVYSIFPDEDRGYFIQKTTLEDGNIVQEDGKRIFGFFHDTGARLSFFYSEQFPNIDSLNSFLEKFVTTIEKAADDSNFCTNFTPLLKNKNVADKQKLSLESIKTIFTDNDKRAKDDFLRFFKNETYWLTSQDAVKIKQMPSTVYSADKGSFPPDYDLGNAPPKMQEILGALLRHIEIKAKDKFLKKINGENSGSFLARLLKKQKLTLSDRVTRVLISSDIATQIKRNPQCHDIFNEALSKGYIGVVETLLAEGIHNPLPIILLTKQFNRIHKNAIDPLLVRNIAAKWTDDIKDNYEEIQDRYGQLLHPKRIKVIDDTHCMLYKMLGWSEEFSKRDKNQLIATIIGNFLLQPFMQEQAGYLKGGEDLENNMILYHNIFHSMHNIRIDLSDRLQTLYETLHTKFKEFLYPAPQSLLHEGQRAAGDTLTDAELEERMFLRIQRQLEAGHTFDAELEEECCRTLGRM